MLATLLFALTLGADEYLLQVRDDHAGVGVPHQLLIQAPPGTIADSLGPPLASDLTFQKASGNNPTVAVFALDADGDGVGDVVHIRQRVNQGSDLQLRVFRTPAFPADDTGKAFASSKGKTLGNLLGDGRVLLIGGGDFDDDGDADVCLVRQFDDGHQELEIRKLPRKQNQSMKKVLASDLTFGTLAGDNNRYLFGADTDDDGVDEIVVIRTLGDGKDHLLIFEAPQVIAGETGPPLASFADVSLIGEGDLLAVGRIDLDGNGRDELIAVHRVPLESARLTVLAFPSAQDSNPATPLFVDTNAAPAAGLSPIRAVAGITGFEPLPPPDPPTDLAGSYLASFAHKIGDLDESIPFVGALPATFGGGQFQLLLPTFHPLFGAYQPTTGKLDFTGALAIIDDVGAGVSWSLVLGIAQASVQQGAVVIEGSYTGVKHLPLNQQATVKAGVFSLRAVP